VVAIEVKPLEEELELVEEGNSTLYVKPLLVELVLVLVLVINIGRVVLAETSDRDTEPNG
jgi:hypothetical protein